MTVVLQILATVTAAAAAFFAVMAITRWLGQVLSVEQAPAPKTEERDEPSYWTLLLNKWAERLKPHLPKGLSKDLTSKITQAGGLNGLTPAQLSLYAMGAAVAGLALGIFLVVVTSWPPWLILAGCVLGAIAPFVWLRDQVAARHRQILIDLAYHLDLLTLCVEAGMDFGAGVARMVDKGKPGALRDEFKAFLAQIRVGKTRAEALEGMAIRVGLEQFSTFLSSLIQADRMGTGLGRTLRLQAEQLRAERFQRAEKLAGEAPVKMLLPLVLFIFPTIWVILGSPLIFNWIFG